MSSLRSIKVANATQSLLGKKALVVGGTDGIGKTNNRTTNSEKYSF